MEKECLDLWLAVEAFRVYLLGRPFFIQTKHAPIGGQEWLKRATRGCVVIQPYRFKVEHRAGSANQNALSYSNKPDRGWNMIDVDPGTKPI